MPAPVVAVANRVRELEALLDGLSSGRWAGGLTGLLAPSLPVASGPGPATVAAGGPHVDPSIPPGPATGRPGSPSAVGWPTWTLPFATVLGDVAGTAAQGVEGRLGATGLGAVVEPVPGGRITQPYTLGSPGVDSAGHDGLDIAAPLGTPVRAIAGGVVRFAGRVKDGAVVVRIEHADGSEALYGHLDPSLPVRVGDRVGAGETIGRIGLTGRTTGPHLHLEVWVDGQTIDPEPVLRAGVLPRLAALGSRPDDAAAALRRFDAIASTIPYAAEIRSAAVEAGIDPLLLAALVRTESGFRPGAVSRAGAMGLTQLMPATARSLGVDDPFEPAQNLDGGARYLAGNLRIFGRVDLALAAYQAGKAAVRQAGGVPDSPVTRAYVARVLDTWAGYLSAAEGRR